MKRRRIDVASKGAQDALRVLTRTAKTCAARTAGYVTDKAADLKRRYDPPSDENWYPYAARSCEAVSDAILRDNPGTSERIVRVTAGKLGAIGVPATIFSTAALIGTASTGTAIGSLSGAAFTSAALAWVGGSVAVGSVVLGVAAIAGGVGAVVGAGWVAKRFVFGRKRERSDIDEQERKIVDASLALALAFRNQEKTGRGIDPVAAKALYDDALKPLCDELLEYRVKASSWPYLAQQRLNKAIERLELITSFTGQFAKNRPNMTTGIVGAVITQLLADDIPSFDENEQFVLDALRRSKTSLADASAEELSAYVKALEPGQLQGLRNNLLGISQELRYYAEENGDGDQYQVELFAATNHPGADVRIINTLTGDVKEVQLKATNYRSYIEAHNERYADIPVFATEEIAAAVDGVESTGIAYDELSRDTESVISGLRDVDYPSVLASMSVAGVITLARNVKVLLAGQEVSPAHRRKLVEDGARSAIVAGLVHTVIG